MSTKQYVMISLVYLGMISASTAVMPPVSADEAAHYFPAVYDVRVLEINTTNITARGFSQTRQYVTVEITQSVKGDEFPAGTILYFNTWRDHDSADIRKYNKSRAAGMVGPALFTGPGLVESGQVVRAYFSMQPAANESASMSLISPSPSGMVMREAINAVVPREKLNESMREE